MKPISRAPVSKHKSSRSFSHKMNKTKSPNNAGPPMRGGWRF